MSTNIRCNQGKDDDEADRTGIDTWRDMYNCGKWTSPVES
jgi:hypothetical protein